ncbi:MAG: hypothetical protein JNK27_06655 [Chitinophagaceae bacterium]|nr:hypothetical protein [Chitinophagaceae bacterium]
MKTKINIFLLSMLLIIYSCKNESTSSEPENNLDAARSFIRSALDGKFNEARNYMLQDSLNNNYLDVAERSYKNSDQAVKDNYRASAIIIHNLSDINDSVSVLIYSNSFKNNHDTLRLIRANDKWLVDLKYLYQHDADTNYNKVTTNDTLQ